LPTQLALATWNLSLTQKEFTVRIDHRWLVLPLFIVVCAARTGDWQTICHGCVARLADLQALIP
jgi:hypothetical protein